MKSSMPLRMRCPVKDYAWGKRGSRSLVSQLTGASEFDKPLAELWMGDHPSGCADVEINGVWQPLSEVIAAQPEQMLGRETLALWGARLPFLLKVISIGEPLSIQVHPDSKKAEQLHRQDPKNYPDPRHKPEVAVALTRSEILFGLKGQSEIGQMLEKVPELKGLKSNASLVSAKGPLPLEVFRALIKEEPEQIKMLTQSVLDRLSQKKDLSVEDRWVLRLADLYQISDPGMLCVYFLKHRILEPGEAVFIKPGTVHAYLDGDMVECMASSDNVIRAGLTSKRKDIDALLDSMDCREAEFPGVRATVLRSGVMRYEVPVAEFVLEKIEGSLEVKCRVGQRASVFVCVRGSGEILAADKTLPFEKGQVYFFPAGIAPCSVKLSEGLIFRASICHRPL